MKLIFAILFVLTSVSCGCTDVQIEKREGKSLLLCQQNFNVIVHEPLAEEELFLVAGAVFYWNQALDGTHFSQVYPQAVSEEQFAGEISVRPSEDVECGAAGWWLKNGCIAAGIVYINAKCRSFEPAWKESLYRHEFGHLLGLAHSECEDDLMAPELSISRDDLPISASPEAIAELKQLYHDRYGW